MKLWEAESKIWLEESFLLSLEAHPLSSNSLPYSSDALKSGPAAALFEYIARSVDQFLTDYGSSSKEDELLMGFTFSFVSLRFRFRESFFR